MAVSDRVKSGPEKAPHRSLWKALGLTDEELKLPLIGVVSAKSECVPGHNHLNNIAQAVKDGIRLAGGVPVEFPAIGVCDGIAMGHVGMKYSLASRELIADSCESMAIAHGFDGMVFIPNCDKIVPGMLMAARRLNLPAMVISGGPMMPGRMPGGSGDMDLNSVFEAVGAYKAGKMDDTQLNAVESAACPGCGSCSGMFTANSMNCITEVIGMALPGNGTIAAVDAARIRLAKRPACGSSSWFGRADPGEDYDRIRVPQRALSGYGAGLLHQHRAASARHRARGRDRLRPQLGQRGERQGAEPVPSRAGRPSPRHRSASGGRRDGRAQRAQRGAACSMKTR